MPEVLCDVRELTADEPELTGGGASVWYSPYRPYTDSSGGVTYRVDREQIKLKLVDGKNTATLPVTPVGEALRVSLRGVSGESYPFYVQIPDTTEQVHLFALPRLDPDTLDPETPLQPAWVAGLEEVQTDVATTATGLDTLTQTVAGLELGAASDTAVATQVADGTETPAAIDARIADGITGKADVSALTAGLATKADATALTSGLALKADAAATTSALAGKQPIDADLTAFAALTPAATQQPSWSSVLGTWAATNPSGIALNAGATNTTVVGTNASSSSSLGTVATIPGTSISVTDSGGRPVILIFDAALVQSVVGTGSVWLVIAETTGGGAPVYRRYNIKPLPNSTAAAFATMTFGLAICPLGVVTTTRTFDLRVAVYQGTGSPAINVANTLTHPTVLYAINL